MFIIRFFCYGRGGAPVAVLYFAAVSPFLFKAELHLVELADKLYGAFLLLVKLLEDGFYAAVALVYPFFKPVYLPAPYFFNLSLVLGGETLFLPPAVHELVNEGEASERCEDSDYY